MLPVFWLFMIPVGGGIPAGVLLAQQKGLPVALTAFLYFVSDVVLAFLFEPVLGGMASMGSRSPRLARAAEAFRESFERTTAHYGAGPVALIMIAFGVDPMTGRAASRAAGHGFVSGWTLAIIGDMMYYAVIAASTLKLSSFLGDPDRAMWIVLIGMFLAPPLIRKAKAWIRGIRARGDISAGPYAS